MANAKGKTMKSAQAPQNSKAKTDVGEEAQVIVLSPIQQAALANENAAFLQSQVNHLMQRVQQLSAENATMRQTIEALTPSEESTT